MIPGRRRRQQVLIVAAALSVQETRAGGISDYGE